MTIRDDQEDALFTENSQCYKDSPSSSGIDPPLKDVHVQSPILSDKKWEASNEVKEHDIKEKRDDRWAFYKTLTVEPLLAMYMISFITRSICDQNLLIDKSCLYVFNQSSNVCSNLDNYTQEKKQIETYADNYNLFVNLIHTLPAVLFSMVIGPWSDKYGRKPPIILSIAGGILQNIGTIMNVMYFDAPMYFLLISSIPAGISGGLVSAILCIYSLASEQTSERQRTIKYAFLELGLGIGTALGTFIGGFLYKKYGYLSVYIFSTSFQVVALLWVMFIVKETRTINTRINCKVISDLFCFDNFKESFHTIIKPREESRRKEICLLVGSMCTLVTTLIATSGFGYFFAKWMYNFDVTVYSNVNTIFMAGGMVVGVLVVLLLSRIFKTKISDSIYGIIGSISVFATNIVKSIATKTWIYYVGCSCGIFGGIALLAVRSRLSKIVKGDELGKVFAFLASCETLIPVLASIVFTQIFNASLDFFPGLAYLISGVLTILPLATFSWIIHKRKNYYELLPN